jgi:DNA-binding response OmpR family regulator
MRVLVVEDEEAIAGAIERGLIKQGYEVDVARDGAEALEMAATTNYDVICLDLNLPRVDGIEVCRRLREERFPGGIIMLTARSSIRERIEGLDQGADDYLVKPFAFSELAARYPRHHPAGRRDA